MTSEMGSEFEFPNTPMAVTKLDARWFKRKSLATVFETIHDIKVWTTKMAGMMARSENFAALSCEASLVKTSKC